MTDPFSGGFDPRMFENVPLFRELAKVMAWRSGPVNWDIASQTAEAIASGTDAGGTDDRAGEEFSQAVGVAELWLDQATSLPAVEGPARTLTRREWVTLATTSDGLGVYVEPIAAGASGALGDQLPEPLQAMGHQIREAMGAMGAMLYGVQVGTVAGHLAGQLLGTYDLGVPTVDPRTVGTVGDTAERFAADYAFERTEFRYWVALREAAHRRQFAGVGWLRDHVSALIRRFASEAAFNPEDLLEQLGGMGFDPSNPEAITSALEQPDAFRVEPTTEQQETLGQLQSLVAFTEAWVDTVIRTAAADKLTALPRIEEAIRRRRASRGPGERFLQQLVGLDLKPSDVRLGQSFCDAVIAARGQEGLDRAWQRASHLPSAAELAEPSRWLVRMAATELGADAGEGDADPA